MVAETCDGVPDDINALFVQPDHAIAALEARSTGPVAEGSTGGAMEAADATAQTEPVTLRVMPDQTMPSAALYISSTASSSATSSGSRLRRATTLRSTLVS